MISTLSKPLGVALALVTTPAMTPLFAGPPLQAQLATTRAGVVRADQFDAVVRRARDLSPVNSLLISHRGELVVEEYFRGMSANRRVNVKSISKSLLSPLVGIAIRDGLIEGVDTPLPRLLPEYFEDGANSHWSDVTLHHVLSMTAGVQGTSFGGYGRWVASDDWIANALARPAICEPGSCWEYSTGNSHIVGVILAHAAGTDLRNYAASALFGHLGIQFRPWDRDPQGHFLGGNNMTVRPRDLIAFGELYLNGGSWEGEQLIPGDWISRSWNEYAVSPWNGHSHGYFWWSREFAGELVHFAWGYGGQFLLVIPQQQAVVAITSSLGSTVPRGHNSRIYDLIRSDLVPALREAGR